MFGRSCIVKTDSSSARRGGSVLFLVFFLQTFIWLAVLAMLNLGSKQSLLVMQNFALVDTTPMTCKYKKAGMISFTKKK